MYKAAIVESLSEDFSSVKIVNLERKTLKQNEIRVLIKAASVNFPDLLMISGLYQFKPEFPFVLGMESAGIIIEAGKDVKNFAVDEKVIFGGKTGSFSEEIVVAQEDIRRKPKSLSWEQASAFTVAYLTSYVALICRGNLKFGESLLIPLALRKGVESYFRGEEPGFDTGSSFFCAKSPRYLDKKSMVRQLKC